MIYYILFFLGGGIIWLSLKISEEVHRLAIALLGLLTLGWGYLASPSTFQSLSGIFILSIYQIYTCRVK